MLSALGELLAAALRLLARMGSFDYATAPLREAVTALKMTLFKESHTLSMTFGEVYFFNLTSNFCNHSATILSCLTKNHSVLRSP